MHTNVFLYMLANKNKKQFPANLYAGKFSLHFIRLHFLQFNLALLLHTGIYLSDYDDINSWVYDNGTTVEQTFWLEGQPDWINHWNMAVMVKLNMSVPNAGRWYTSYLTDTAGYYCEKPPLGVDTTTAV